MSLGLTTRHAYALLNLYTQDNLRLIQLRNPWAKGTQYLHSFSSNLGALKVLSSSACSVKHSYINILLILNIYGLYNIFLFLICDLSLDTWSGPYHNKCPKWTEALRSELMVYPDSSEAVFWMELSDFVRYTPCTPC